MLSILVLGIGLKTNFQFKCAVSWGLAFICLLLSAFFTRYIPDKKNANSKSLKEE